jgi:hypothetical protein
MPHRIVEIEKIAADLFRLGQRATELGELQVAKAIVDAVAATHAAKVRISTELKSVGLSDTDPAL